jgi:hypothetical protein
MMNNKKIEYTAISVAKITETRAIVISECSKGGYTLAQRMEVNEDGKKTQVYLKGATHINDIQGLYNLRDAVNLAIKKVEEGIPEDADWDELE